MSDFMNVPRSPGTYMLVLHLPEPHTLTVGKLGQFDFPAGYYLYAGSARGGLLGRVSRHLRADKKLHWHIDYLNSQQGGAEVVDVWWQTGKERLECDFADAARRLQGATLPAHGFGSSDCGCDTHLVHVSEKPDITGIEKSAGLSLEN
jgi:Uri superfamily endonuclease